MVRKIGKAPLGQRLYRFGKIWEGRGVEPDDPPVELISKPFLDTVAEKDPVRLGVPKGFDKL